MKMHMKNALQRRSTVIEQEMDALALEAGGPHCGGDGHCPLEHDAAYIRIQICQRAEMLDWHDHDMAGVHRADRHEGSHYVIPIDERSFGASSQDLAEDAAALGHP